MSAYGDAGLGLLGDPTRRAIFELLARRPSSVQELADQLPISRPAVSQHLKVLRDGGLVVSQPEGTRRIYRLNPHGVGALRTWLEGVWDQALTDFHKVAEQTAADNLIAEDRFADHHQVDDSADRLHRRWRVRDVVAHMFSYEDLGLLALVRRFAAARFNADRVNAIGVAVYAEYGPTELLARVREHLQPSGLTARFGSQIALTDGVIHHQDIRRALALPRDVPLDRVQGALRFAPRARPIGAPKRIRGLRLDAIDLDWATGDGPTVEGPGEALLMAMAGRPAALPELSGPGTPIPAERITNPTVS